MSRRIELTKGQFATVDDEDYDGLMKFFWQATRLVCAKTDNEFVAVCAYDKAARKHFKDFANTNY